MDKQRVGLLGATSLVGECLLSLLMSEGAKVTAFSRQRRENQPGVEWRLLGSNPAFVPRAAKSDIPFWICVAPIWALPEHFGLLESCGVRRIVAVSSTSLFVKGDSPDPIEQEIARHLCAGEATLRVWAEARGVEWVLLRPPLIYGRGRDKNIAEIVRFIRRFGFFPLFGRARGLRQPVHAEDVAGACLAALRTSRAANRAFNISGNETLAYREMVSRVFAALDRRPRLLTVPLSVFRIAVACLRLLPRYRHWSVAMVERMNRDLVYDHTDAARDLDFKPRAFLLTDEDVAV